MTPPPPFEAAKPKFFGHLYLLRSLKDKRFYLGWTTDLNRRLDAHNSGLVQSTKSRRPFELLHVETYPSVKEAKDMERKLKHNPRMYAYFKKRALLCASLPNGRKEVVG